MLLYLTKENHNLHLLLRAIPSEINTSVCVPNKAMYQCTSSLRSQVMFIDHPVLPTTLVGGAERREGAGGVGVVAEVGALHVDTRWAVCRLCFLFTGFRGDGGSRNRYGHAGPEES